MPGGYQGDVIPALGSTPSYPFLKVYIGHYGGGGFQLAAC